MYLCSDMKPVVQTFGRPLLGAMLAVYVLSGCKKKKDDHDHSPPPQNQPDSVWVKLGHIHSSPGDKHMDVFVLLHRSQGTQVQEGYNVFRIKVDNYSGPVAVYPVRFIGTSPNNTCPVRNPQSRSGDGFYYADVMFNHDGTWKLNVVLSGGDTARLDMNVVVHPRGWVRRKPWRGGNPRRMIYEFRPDKGLTPNSNPASLYVTWGIPSGPGGPLNPANFYVAKVDTISEVRIDTWMPSMSHGSPGNDKATHQPNGFGHYKGKVGFNMNGDWHIYLTFMRAGTQDSVLRDTIALNLPLQ